MAGISFDRSAFVDSDTGKFRFPSYASAPGSLVRVKDRTKYVAEFWTAMDYTAQEKRAYDIKMFEGDVENGGCEIEVDGFETLFQPKNKKFLGEFGFLSKEYDLVEQIAFALTPEDDNEPFVADRPAHRELIARHVLVPVEDRRVALDAFGADYLKPAAKAAGIKLSQKKADLIADMIDRDAGTDLPPVVRVGAAAKGLLERLCGLYILDIERSTKTWHPLVRCFVWETVADEAEIEIVARLAEARRGELGICPE